MAGSTHYCNIVLLKGTIARDFFNSSSFHGSVLLYMGPRVRGDPYKKNRGQIICATVPLRLGGTSESNYQKLYEYRAKHYLLHILKNELLENIIFQEYLKRLPLIALTS